MSDTMIDDPKKIIEDASIFSEELKMYVVPKHVALLAIEMSKLDKAFEGLSKSMSLLNNLDKEIN